MDRLTSMAVFAKVLERRSFSAAARELGISQATVSKHVQTLEAWLGTQLLVRTTRRVASTPAGEGFYTRCQRILADVADARPDEPGAALRGRIRLALPAGFVAACLGTALGHVVAENPLLAVDAVLTETPPDPIAGGFDAVVMLGATSGPGLIARTLAELPLVLCAAPAYVGRCGRPETPEDLTRHDCLNGIVPEPALWRFAGAMGEASVAVGGRLVSRSAVLLHDAAIADAGVLLAPACLVREDLAAGRLERVLEAYTPVPAVLTAVYPADRHLSTRLQTILTALATALAP
jgi:DNA-binding transcriptional LysR family regulator